jgi:hypothetical protein
MKIRSVLCVALIVLALQAPEPAHSAKPPEQDRQLTVQDGLVTFQGRQPSLLQVLNQICTAANLEVFVFEQIEDTQVSLEFRDKPVEEAVRSLLRGRNYSVVYQREGKSAGLRLVPVGKARKHEAAAVSVQGAPSVASRAVSGQESPSEPGQGGGAQTPEGALPGSARFQGASGEEGAVVPSSGMSVSYASGEGVAAAESRGKTETSSDQVSSGSTQDASSPRRTASHQMTPEAKLERLITMYEQRIASGVSDKEYEINMKLSGGGYVAHDRDRVQFWKEALERHAGR